MAKAATETKESKPKITRKRLTTTEKIERAMNDTKALYESLKDDLVEAEQEFIDATKRRYDLNVQIAKLKVIVDPEIAPEAK